MDGLPSDPSDQSGNNGSSKIAVPPPFGSSFSPHSNPVNQNNPYQTSNPVPPTIPTIPENPDPLKHEHYSEVAQHKQRDEHGHFIHTDHPETLAGPTSVPQGQAPLNPSGLPSIIEINQNTKPTDKKDPPLFGFFITNPVTYLKAFLSKLLKRQMITLRIPVLALIIIMVGVGGGVGGFGLGVKTGINYALGKLFPGFSPILHRSITAQGTIQKSSNGYFLQANDKDKTLWTLNPASANVNLADFEGMRVQIKGNLTPTPNLIEVSEVISFDKINP